MKILTQGPIQIHLIPDGPIQANTWLIDVGPVTCLIDPVLRPGRCPAELAPVAWLLATHGHFDHIGRADEWRDLTGAPLLIHESEQDALTDAEVNLSVLIGRSQTMRPAQALLVDGWQQMLAADIEIEALHTPGHTVGSMCFLLSLAHKPIALFTGDTLFAGAIGRTDLGGDDQAMQASLLRLIRLASRTGPQIPVLPGHGPATTLGREISSNPWLQGLT